MSQPSDEKPGSIDSLFEQATLDALGILSDEEVELFEAALRDAPEALRRQLIRQHALSADLTPLLPDVEPPSALRDRVLRAVSAAIAESKGETRAVPHRVATAAVTGARHRVLHAKRVHSMWRSAAVGLSVAVVAIAALFLRVQRDLDQGEELFAEGQVIDAIGMGQIGDIMFDARTRKYHLTPTVEAPSGAAATLYHMPERGVARLYLYQLPADPGTTYRVVATDGRGRELDQIASFRVDRPVASIELPAHGSTMHLAVMVDRPGEPASVAIFETSVSFV